MAALSVDLTDTLLAYVEAQTGPGTPYVSAEDFVRDMIRERMECDETDEVFQSIVDGFEDAIAGRVVPYSGDLRADMRKPRPE